MRRKQIADHISRSFGPALLLVLSAFFASPAVAHVAGDLRGGYNTDVDRGLIGGGINADIAPSWDFNPNAEWVFVEGYDMWSVNADFHYDFNTEGPAVWLGAGPALLVTDDEGSLPANQDLGLNLLGGLGARRGQVRPYGQVKVTLSNDSSSSMAFGFRF